MYGGVCICKQQCINFLQPTTHAQPRDGTRARHATAETVIERQTVYMWVLLALICNF